MSAVVNFQSLFDMPLGTRFHPDVEGYRDLVYEKIREEGLRPRDGKPRVYARLILQQRVFVSRHPYFRDEGQMFAILEAGAK